MLNFKIIVSSAFIAISPCVYAQEYEHQWEADQQTAVFDAQQQQDARMQQQIVDMQRQQQQEMRTMQDMRALHEQQTGYR